ncbi:MAG TPA: hypothetical protein VGW09_09290 [Nitrososphaeraceae archaeon]|nr:hypothetical protein [Nitrososphaeraceae archaeon]
MIIVDFSFIVSLVRMKIKRKYICTSEDLISWIRLAFLGFKLNNDNTFMPGNAILIAFSLKAG